MTHFIESLIANFILPLATILFPGDAPWFESNFSVMGSGDRRVLFILWGSFAGLYFYYFLSRVFRLLPRHAPSKEKRERFLLKSSGVLLALAIVTPYLPLQFPVLSHVHVAAAFLSSIGLILCLLSVTGTMKQAGHPRGDAFHLSVLVIALCCGILLLIVGIVSSGLEVYFVVSCSLLVHRLKVSLAG